MKTVLPNKLYFILFLFILGINFSCLAQWQNGLWVGKQANNFIWGSGAHLNFNTTPPSANAIPNNYLYNIDENLFDDYEVYEGTTGISDTLTGELLFYEFNHERNTSSPIFDNGNLIFNKNHQIMVNGDSIIGNVDITQKSIVIPIPESDNKYYLFSLGNYYYEPIGASLFYSEIDMDLDNGLGAVVTKNNFIMDSVGEKMTAVHHANQKDIWLMKDGNYYSVPTVPFTYYNFLITNQGISAPVVNTFPYVQTERGEGQMKFSPDGKKIAETNRHFGYSIFLYDFDNQTGQMSNRVDLSSIIQPGPLGGYKGGYGLEFSPNGRYLYVSEFGVFDEDIAKLHQFDTQAGSQAAILASHVLIKQIPANLNGPPYDFFMSMQLGLDGKIYMGTNNYPHTIHAISVINNPNNAGLDCRFTMYSQPVYINPAEDLWGMPAFIQSYFESGILYDDACTGQVTTFETIRIPDITAIAWDFGDGSNGAGVIGTHTYTQAGTYTVTATITSNGAQQTATTEITVIQGAIANMPSDLEVCQSDPTVNALFDLSEQDSAILNGQNPAQHEVTYHTNLNDAEDGTNTITPNNNYSAADGTTIYARVINTTTGCYDVTSFMLQVGYQPAAPNISPIISCDTDVLDGSYYYDLTLRAEDLQAGQPNTNLSYFASQIDAENDTNVIADPTNFLAGTVPMVYVRITADDPDVDCYAVAQIDLQTEPITENGSVLTLQGCPPFDLTEVEAEFPTSYVISYYTSEIDAQNDTDAIVNPVEYTNNEIETIYIRLTDVDGCGGVAQLDLDQENCFFLPQGISPNGDGLNDTFDLLAVNASYGIDKLTIFNRHGRIVFEKNDYVDEWMGQDIDGNELPTATYFYVLQLNRPHVEFGQTIKKWVYVQR